MKKIICILVGSCMIFSCIFLDNYHKQEKEELQSMIGYQINAKETYTPNSYQEYADALNEAIAINEKSFASVEEINEAKDNLQKKIESLYSKPDKTELTEKYEDIKRIDTDLYLPNSTLSLKEAMENASFVIRDDNAILEEIDAAMKQMDEAVLSLIEKPDKTELNNLIPQANNLDKTKYTTTSYQELEKRIEEAVTLVNDDNATQVQIDDALQNVKNGINQLVQAQKARYKITIDTYLLSNNHVGNEWGKAFRYNNQTITSGEVITEVSNSTITIQAEIVENDTVPDIGTSQIQLTLKDNNTATAQITVQENRGRYSGNIAVWEVRCSINLIEII